jgi:hypothetical protein
MAMTSGCRQFACAEMDSGFRVRNLVETHLGHDCPGPNVLNRQFAEVMIKVRFDLSLGFGQKAQAPGVAQFASSDADGQRAKVPDRVQQACAPAQINKAALGPGQMFGFLVGSFLAVRAAGPDRDRSVPVPGKVPARRPRRRG